MKAWEVVLLEEAGADLLSGRAFYDQQGAHVGDYFWLLAVFQWIEKAGLDR